MSTFLPYGTFNPLAKKRDQSKLSDRLPNSLFDQMKELIKRSMEADVLEGTGPYKGIVLRVDDPQGEGSGSNYLLRYFKEVVGQMPTVISMKVRIPELHAHIPEPEQFNSEEGSHQSIINLYPTFYYIGYDSPTFSPEDIVSCDFLDKKNFTGGVVHKLDPMFSTPIREASIIDAFQPTPPMLSESAAGDSMSVGDQPGSVAPPEEKVSNTDPETDVKHSDRIFVEQDYRYPIPQGGNSPNFSYTGPTSVENTQQVEAAKAKAAAIKSQLGSNVDFQQASKSMIIYNSSLGRAKYMRTTTAATRRAKKAGITTVFIEAVWQGPPEGDLGTPEQRVYEFNRLRDYARAFSKQGIGVFLWGRVNQNMAKDFCNYIFMVAKKVGAIGVVVNPEVSYTGLEEGFVEEAKFLSTMIKTKASEFNLLSGVYLPWFSKWLMIDGDSEKPLLYQSNFPYEEFYGFDIYLIDARWDNRYKQWDGLLSNLAIVNPITGETADAVYTTNDSTGSHFVEEYKNFIQFNNPDSSPAADGNYFPSASYMYRSPSPFPDTFANITSYYKLTGLHDRLDYGESRDNGFTTERRNYIPVLSVDGANFFAPFYPIEQENTPDGKKCRGMGIKTPIFFERECKDFFLRNNVKNSTVSLVSSICISSWAAAGRHQNNFTKSRWQVIEEMKIPTYQSDYMRGLVSWTTNNGEYATNNAANPQNWTSDTVATDYPGNLFGWGAGIPEENTGAKDPDYYLRLDPNNSKTLVDIPRAGLEMFNMTNKPARLLKNNLAPLDTDRANFILSDVDMCAVIKSEPVFNGRSLITGQPAAMSTQTAKILPSVNAAKTPGVNPASALSTLGAAMIASADDPFDYSKVRPSPISWGFDANVQLNAKIVDYMNKLADKVYKTLPLHSPAFKNQQYDKLWVTKGKKSVVKQVLIMFNKFTGKTSGANVSNSVFNSIYPQPWAQQIKHIFSNGLRTGQSHFNILQAAAAKMSQLISEGKLHLPHLTDDSVDIYTSGVHAAMGEMNPYAMTTSQMHKTKFVRTIKQAAAEIGSNKVEVEDYEQHVHIKI